MTDPFVCPLFLCSFSFGGGFPIGTGNGKWGQGKGNRVIAHFIARHDLEFGVGSVYT
jgi:hypothetical protein